MTHFRDFLKLEKEKITREWFAETVESRIKIFCMNDTVWSCSGQTLNGTVQKIRHRFDF